MIADIEFCIGYDANRSCSTTAISFAAALGCWISAMLSSLATCRRAFAKSRRQSASGLRRWLARLKRAGLMQVAIGAKSESD
jgi:hypothetical protein